MDLEFLTPTIILIAMIGMVINILIYILNSTKGKNKFSLKILVKDHMNWVRWILSILSAIVLLLMMPDLAVMFNVNLEGHGSLLKIVAFNIGYWNHALIKDVLELFKKPNQTFEM